MGRERCSAEPVPSPTSSFAGRTERAPGTGVLRTPYLQRGPEKGAGRVPVPGYGGEGRRATVLPAHARPRTPSG